MSVKDRILDFVARFPGRDDDEIASALSIRPRQTVNLACRELMKADRVERRVGPRGKIANYPTGSATSSNSTAGGKADFLDELDRAFDWYWEGNVCASVTSFLRENGWTITGVADTKSKQRGPDVVAVRKGQSFIVEAKGFPSTNYRDERRAAERKPTPPTNQAQHWYAQAILKALRLQHAHPDAVVGIALPDFPRYRALFAETTTAFTTLGIMMLFVSESSAVEVVGPAKLHR